MTEQLSEKKEHTLDEKLGKIREIFNTSPVPWTKIFYSCAVKLIIEQRAKGSKIEKQSDCESTSFWKRKIELFGFRFRVGKVIIALVRSLSQVVTTIQPIEVKDPQYRTFMRVLAHSLVLCDNDALSKETSIREIIPMLENIIDYGMLDCLVDVVKCLYS